MATGCKNEECSGWAGRYHIEGCAYATPDTSREAYSGCRVFDTGATRSPLADKPQYEGYLNPLVIKRFGEYMLKHQTQADGRRRDADNWQKGIPPASLMDSKMRHDMDVWLHHRGYPAAATEPMEEALCAVLFNTMALLLAELSKTDRAGLTVMRDLCPGIAFPPHAEGTNRECACCAEYHATRAGE